MISFFYIGDFIWIITLTEKSNLKKFADLKVYWKRQPDAPSQADVRSHLIEL